jgi:hypothetical protein
LPKLAQLIVGKESGSESTPVQVWTSALDIDPHSAASRQRIDDIVAGVRDAELNRGPARRWSEDRPALELVPYGNVLWRNHQVSAEEKPKLTAAGDESAASEGRTCGAHALSLIEAKRRREGRETKRRQAQ